MTDTGQVPGEGLPESAGMVDQPGAPAHGAYTYLSETTAEDEDLLLLPGAQGAWGNEVPPPPPEPVVEAVHEPGPHEISGRDSGSVDLSAVRLPDPPVQPAMPSPARRPLHLGPPIPDTSASPVRSLADRGAVGAPVRQPGPEYLDVPQPREMSPQGAAPWGAPGAVQTAVQGAGAVQAPVTPGAPAAETVVPGSDERAEPVGAHAAEPVGAAQAAVARLATEAVAATAPLPAEAGEEPGPVESDPGSQVTEAAPSEQFAEAGPAEQGHEGGPGADAQAPRAGDAPFDGEAAQVSAEMPAFDAGHPAEAVQGPDAGPAPEGAPAPEAVQASDAGLAGEAALVPEGEQAPGTGPAAGVAASSAAGPLPDAVPAPEAEQAAAAHAGDGQESGADAGADAGEVPGTAAAPDDEQAPAAVAAGPEAVEASAAVAASPEAVVAPAAVAAGPEAVEASAAVAASPEAVEASAAVAAGPEAEGALAADVVGPVGGQLPNAAPAPEAGHVSDAGAAPFPDAGQGLGAGPTAEAASVAEGAAPAPQADASGLAPGSEAAAHEAAAQAAAHEAAAQAAVHETAVHETVAQEAVTHELGAPEAVIPTEGTAPAAGPLPETVPAPAPVQFPEAGFAADAEQAPAAALPDAAQVPGTAPVPDAEQAPASVATPGAGPVPAAAPGVGEAPEPSHTHPSPQAVSFPAAPDAAQVPQPGVGSAAPGVPHDAPQHFTPPEHPVTAQTQTPTDVQGPQLTSARQPVQETPSEQNADPAASAAVQETPATEAHTDQPVGRLVQADGSVPTAPDLAPAPPQALALPPEDQPAPEPVAAVPAARDGDPGLTQHAEDLDTRAADQEDQRDQQGPDEESTAPVEDVRRSTGPAAPAYDDAEREAVLKVMRERRDIRNGFRSDPIPHEVLLRVLEAAHTAPSVGHSQPWDFVVIRSADTRRAMHELAMRQRDAYAKSLPKGRAKQFKELKIEAILDTPVNIVVTADPTRGGRHTLGRHTQPQMAPYSAALAVENLWLAARAEGLGVGWVSFFDEREMVRALGLPEHLEVIAYLCVGYVDEFPDEPELLQAGWSKRRPLSWVVHEETYGRRALPGEEPHDLLAETVAQIRPLDAKALGEAWERQKRMTKPAGALGMLEIISAQLSGLSRQCPPPIPEPAAVAIFAGDHGVHAQGVTPWPQEVTAQMVANFLGGGAVCNAFAGQVGAEVCVVDVGVASDLPATPGLLPRKVRAGTSDMTTGPAMTREEAKQAIEVGIETARDLVAAGNKALLTGEMGIANTTASAALISVFTDADPAEVTGRGTGINDETLARKTEVVRRALELHQPDPADPIGVLAAVGGFEHAAMVGLLLGGASLRTPVILDGVSAGAAALVARAIAPEVLAACIAGHRSAEPGHVAALNKLGLRPLVDLDLRLGEGTGALLALPLVQSTARAMHEVATFDSAGVTEK